MLSRVVTFGAGFVAGWLVRSAFGSSREAVVSGIAFAMRARDRVRRVAAEQVEWWEDMVAEAQARRESAAHEGLEGQAEAPLRPVRTDRKGGTAA
jgi:hypothetical protein